MCLLFVVATCHRGEIECPEGVTVWKTQVESSCVMGLQFHTVLLTTPFSSFFFSWFSVLPWLGHNCAWTFLSGRPMCMWFVISKNLPQAVRHREASVVLEDGTFPCRNAPSCVLTSRCAACISHFPPFLLCALLSQNRTKMGPNFAGSLEIVNPRKAYRYWRLK